MVSVRIWARAAVRRQGVPVCRWAHALCWQGWNLLATAQTWAGIHALSPPTRFATPPHTFGIKENEAVKAS